MDNKTLEQKRDDLREVIDALVDWYQIEGLKYDLRDMEVEAEPMTQSETCGREA